MSRPFCVPGAAFWDPARVGVRVVEPTAPGTLKYAMLPLRVVHLYMLPSTSVGLDEQPASLARSDSAACAIETNDANAQPKPMAARRASTGTYGHRVIGAV